MKSQSDFILAFGMLITGSINTLSTKWADNMNSTGVPNTPGAANPPKPFNHPFVQAAGMFVGEFLCILVFKLLVWNEWRRTSEGQRSGPSKVNTAKPFSVLIFMLPACCDMTGTSCMYVGLTLTHASVFQMLRGSVVLFTGILSVIVLKRKLRGFHWLGMFFVLIGVGIVGMSPLLEHDVKPEPSASNPVLGNILIILAQMIVAVQMVIEEKFIGGYNIPALQAVGWEGIWGTLILSTFVFVMYYIPPLPGIGNPGSQHFEDALDAFTQISHNGLLALAILGNVLSIAFFNFFGISVTKAMSASHRMVLDSVRTIVIWAVSLAVGWQSFNFLQLVGFVILLAGTAIYNELVTVPGFPTKFEGEDSDDDTMAEYWQMDDSEGGNGGKRGGASAYSLENESQSLLSPRITQADELFTPRFSKNIARGR